MIVSFIEGRIRLRNNNFKNEVVANNLISLIKAQEGIYGVNHNIYTGSILIEYNPDALNSEQVKEALLNFYPQAADYFKTDIKNNLNFKECFFNKLPKIKFNKDSVTYLLMLASFGACIGSGFLRSKGLHIQAGLALATLTAQHVYKYRTNIVTLLKEHRSEEVLATEDN